LARQKAPDFADGACFVSLAEAQEATLVAAEILKTLGSADVGFRPAVDLVVDQLAHQEILLVLDNFEHVIEAAVIVAKIAESCPRVKVIVTSRRPLAIRAEHSLNLLPFCLPESNDVPLKEALQNDAVALLVARLESVDSRFRLSEAAVPVAVGICRRLDGLPLAIELAAARSRVLPLSAILDGLEERLSLLTSGQRDAPPRHQTMRSAVAWSYELLTPLAASLFRHLAVCVGAIGFETIVALTEDLEISQTNLVDLLDELVTHGLVQRREGDEKTRFGQLEVIREFATEALAGTNDADDAHRRHAAYFRDFAESAAQHYTGPEQSVWLDRLAEESSNLNAAVRWAVQDGDAECALRLCLALRFLWYVRGSIAEGRSLFAAALALPNAHLALRARALVEASALARHNGDFACATSLVAEALEIARAGEDEDLLASALLQQGFVLHLIGQYPRARVALEESLSLRLQMNDSLGIARASHHLGLVAYFGDADTALAWEMQSRCLALFRDLGNERHITTTLIAMGEVARARGGLEASRELLSEAFVHIGHLEDVPLLVYALRHCAALAADEGHLHRAVRLLGAAEGLEHASGAAPWPAVASQADDWLPAVERRLGATRVTALRTAGQRLSAVEAASLATQSEDRSLDPLTAKEHDVARLVADGLTNKAIAECLFVSERTVEGHVARILAKLGFRSRAQIAAWVAGATERAPG
jgi:non-specific serine/threonine protein kinase